MFQELLYTKIQNWDIYKISDGAVVKFVKK